MSTYQQRRSGARNGARATEQAIREEKQRQTDVEAARQADLAARRLAERYAEAIRVKFTAADLADASHVRSSIGWHHLVRVNAKSVTVRSKQGEWNDRLPIERVLQFAVNGKAVTP